MSFSSSPIRLVAPDFQPPDDQGVREVAWTTSIQSALSIAANINYWFVRRPMLLCIVWSLWLSILYFGLGPASYVKVPDCGNGTLPARLIFAQQFLQGELGQWMAFSGCGVDRVINNYRLEPPCVLLGLLPGWLAYGLIMWLQRFIACYFMLRLTRDDLKFDDHVAALSALSYSLFEQIGIHWQWDGFTLYDGLGIPGLPLLFWVTNRLVERNIAWALFGAAATGVCLGLCAPFFQTLFFPFLAVYWYTVLQPAWSGKRLLLLSVMFAGWAAICLPEMLSAARYVPESHRAEIVIRSQSPYVKYIENVQHWSAAVARSNKLALLVGLIGFLCIRFRDRRLPITLLTIAGVLWFVSVYYSVYDRTLAHLGILASFHFHRLIYLLPFLCAITLGLGLMAIPADTAVQLTNSMTGLKIVLRPAMIFLVSTAIVVQSGDLNARRWRQIIRGESYHQLYQHPDLLALAEQTRDAPAFRVACISDLWRPNLGMHDSAFWSFSPGICWAYGFETTDGYQVLYAKRYKQYWTQVLQPLLARDPIRMQQHVYWGNMVFLWHPSHNRPPNLKFDDYYHLPLLSLANTRYIVSPLPLVDRRLRLLPSEQREQFLKWEKRSSGERTRGALRQEWSFKPLYIYENQEYLPRYFLATQAKLFDDSFDLLMQLRTASAEDLRRTIYFTKSDIPSAIDLAPLMSSATSSNEPGQVLLISQHADFAEYELEATGPCLFFVSNTHHPHWRATLNGKPTPLLPAHHAFQGVFIPAAGKHRLVMQFGAK